MKKVILLSLSLFCITFCYAQKVSFGVAGGLNMTKVEFDDNDEVDFEKTLKTSFNGGVYAQISLIKGKLLLQPQIMYSAEGFVSKVQDPNDSNSEEKNLKLI